MQNNKIDIKNVRGKKRILIFSTAYFPMIGGAEIAVREITSRINDVEFIMVAPRLKKELPEKEIIDNVLIYRIGKGNNFDKFRLFFAGPKFVKSFGKFDVVWAIMASYAGLTALRYKNKNPEVKFLLTLQEGDSKTHIYKHVWFIWPYFKQIFKRADIIQAISKFLADWARDLGAKSEIKVIPNGVDVRNSEFSPELGQVRYGVKINNLELRKDLNIDSNEKVIVTVSRLVKKNGVNDLIKSMVFLNNNIHLIIVGDGELRAHLEKVVKENKLDVRVHFVGTVPPNKINNYLKNSDVFCRPSLSEGLGNAFLEAMAVGVPTIGTPVGGIPDFLVDDETGLPGEANRAKTGWFCEVKNPESIAEKIKYILDEKNKEEVERVKHNAKKMVEEQYNWDKIAKNIYQLF